MAGLWVAAGPCLLLWDGNLLGSIYSKFSFKICAPKWVNCFLLTTLNLPARDGQLTLPLIFPGKKLVIHHHVVASWCARLGPGEERARLGLSNHEGARAGPRQKQESQMPWLLPSSSLLTVLLLAKPGPKLVTREPGEAGLRLPVTQSRGSGTDAPGTGTERAGGH